MPTMARRRKWWASALATFHAQTYPYKELLIGSEDGDALASIEAGPGVRLMQTPPLRALGAKRNWINRHARGSIIAHWDDDDWYYADRIREMAKLLETNAHIHVSGYRTCVFQGVNGPLLYSAPGDYVVGSSLCYRSSWWRAHPFPDGKQVGEDTDFVNFARRARVLMALPGEGRIIARDHGMNSHQRNIKTPQWSPWRGPWPDGYQCV